MSDNWQTYSRTPPVNHQKVFFEWSQTEEGRAEIEKRARTGRVPQQPLAMHITKNIQNYAHDMTNDRNWLTTHAERKSLINGNVVNLDKNEKSSHRLDVGMGLAAYTGTERVDFRPYYADGKPAEVALLYQPLTAGAALYLGNLNHIANRTALINEVGKITTKLEAMETNLKTAPQRDEPQKRETSEKKPASWVEVLTRSNIELPRETSFELGKLPEDFVEKKIGCVKMPQLKNLAQSCKGPPAKTDQRTKLAAALNKELTDTGDDFLKTFGMDTDAVVHLAVNRSLAAELCHQSANLVIAVDTIRLEKNKNESLELQIESTNTKIETVMNEFLDLQKKVADKTEEVAKLRKQLTEPTEKDARAEELNKEISQLRKELGEAKTENVDERVERMRDGGGEDSKKRLRELESEVETKRVKITELETAQVKYEKNIKTLKKTISALTEVADDD